MALGLTAAQRTESTLAANALDGARFRAAADAGIAYAVLHLLAPPTLDLDVAAAPAPRRRGPARGMAAGRLAEALDLRRGAAWPSRSPTRRRASTSTRPMPMSLTALLMVLGVPEDAGRARWRIASSTGVTRTIWWDSTGPRTPTMPPQGLPYGAKDGPFTSVEELRQVLAVTPDLYARLAPELTVDSGADQVDQQFASAAVLAAVQGVPLKDAQATVTERAQPKLPGAVPGSRCRSLGRGGPVYRIRVARGAGCVGDPSGGRRMRLKPRPGAGARRPAPPAWPWRHWSGVEQGGKPPSRSSGVVTGWRRRPPPPPPDAAGALWR